jgi:hypothetical protein
MAWFSAMMSWSLHALYFLYDSATQQYGCLSSIQEWNIKSDNGVVVFFLQSDHSHANGRPRYPSIQVGPDLVDDCFDVPITALSSIVCV